MTTLRRYLVVQTLLLWQGGFLFYAAVVVPAGSEQLGTLGQGAITARVTDSLNVIGVVGLAAIAWELALTRDPIRRRTRLRWCCWAVAAICQIALFILHAVLDSYMDPDRRFIVNGPPFHGTHRAYLWTSTLQWFACTVAMWWALRAWAAEAN